MAEPHVIRHANLVGEVVLDPAYTSPWPGAGIRQIKAMVDPLTVACPHCGATAGQRCMMVSDWARKPHAARVKASRGSPLSP